MRGRAARRRALAVAVAAVALAALLIPLLAGRATSATPLAYVFNGSQGLRAAAVLSQPTYLSGKSVGLVNSVESTGWKVLPYWQNGQLALNTSVASVVITINNAQASATPAPFDQFINITLQQVESVLGTTVGSYLWSQAESNDFLNVLFVNSSGMPLYAWVQNFTSSWVAFWVKLPNGVPAKGAVNITLEFTPSSQYPYTGLAPYLTSTYGQYDNGEDVFIIYQNFAGTTLPSGWTAVSGTNGSDYVVNNGLQLKTTNAFIEGPNVAQNFILEGYFRFISDAYNGWDFGVYASSSSAYGMHPDGGGNTNNWVSTWYYNDGYTKISTSGAPVGTGYYYLFQIINNAGSITINFDTPSYTTLYSASFTNSLSNAHIALGKRFDGEFTGQSLNVIFYWIRVRPLPPNNVMPSYTVVGGYPVGQYLVWRYTPISNTVNITLHVTSYPINTANTVGVALYSSNIGNLQTDSSGSFYGLLISFNGSILYHAPGSLYTSLKSSAFPTPKAPFTMTVLLTQSSGNITVSYVYINGTAYAVNLVTPMPWTDIGYVGLRASPGNSLYVSYFGVSPSPFGGVEDFINSVESTSWKVLPYWWNGELVVNSTGATSGGQYIAWHYSPISNTINITVHVPSFPVQASGENPGLEILSPNVGDQTSDSNSGFYALVIDFSGSSIWFHSPTSSWEQLYSSLPQPNPNYPFTFTVILTENPFTGDVVVSMIYINSTAYTINVSTSFPWSQIGYVGIRGDIGNAFYVSYFGVSPVYLGPYITTSRLYLTPASSMSWGAVAWQAYYNGNSNLTVSLVGTYTQGSSPPGDLDIGLFLTPTGWGVNSQSNFSVPIAPVSLSVLGAAPALMSSTNYLLVVWSPYFAYEGLSYDTRVALVYFNGSTSIGVIKYSSSLTKIGVPSPGNLINFTVTYVPASGELVVFVKNLNTGASEEDFFNLGFKAGAGWYAFFVGAGNGLDYANWQVLNITVTGASVIASESTSTVTAVTTYEGTTISTSTTGTALVTVTSITSFTNTNLTTAPSITTTSYTTNSLQLPTVGTSVTYVTVNSTSTPLTVIFTGAYANVTPTTITERSFSVNYTTATPYATALTYVFNATEVTITTIHLTTYINATYIPSTTNTTVTQTFYVTQYETSNGMVTTYYSTTVVENTTLSTSSRTTTTNSTMIINGASLATLTSYGTVTTEVSSTAMQVIVNSTASTESGVNTVSISTTVTSTTTVGKTISVATLTATMTTISGTSTAVTTSPTVVTFTINSTGVTTIYTVTEETISGGKVYVNETTATRYVTYDITDVTVYENITTVIPTYGVFANGYGFYIVISTPAPVRYLSYMVYAYFANYSQMVVVASPLYTSVTGNYTLVIGYNLTSGVQHIVLSTILTNQTLSTTITVNDTPTVYFGQQRFDPILWVVTPPAQLPSLNSDYLVDATILFVAAVAGAFMFHSNRRDAALGLVAFALFATFILSLSSAPLFAYASLAGFLAVIGAVILVIVERNREA